MAVAQANDVPPGFEASNPRRDILADLPDRAIEQMTIRQLMLWVERAGGVCNQKQRPKKKEVVDTLKSLRDLVNMGMCAFFAIYIRHCIHQTFLGLIMINYPYSYKLSSYDV